MSALNRQRSLPVPPNVRVPRGVAWISEDDFLPAVHANFRRAVSDGSDYQPEALYDASAGTFESGHVTRPVAILRDTSRSVIDEDESPDRRRLDSTLSTTPSHEAEPDHRKSTALPKLSIFLGRRCTRVHFVRHAEGNHNVVTREAGKLNKPIVEKIAAAALSDALAAGKSQAEAQAMADVARTAAMREEENRPVHFATAGASAYTDAELTEAGRNQCYALRGKIDRNKVVEPLDRVYIDLVVVSPLRRCLETADIIFGPGYTEGRPELKPFLVHDLCRERYGEFYCDKRRSLSENQSDPRYREWDWETMVSSMPSKHPYADEDEAWAEDREPEEHVRSRAQYFLQWLSNRPERELAVVTHSSFLKNLFKVFGGDTSKGDQDVLRAVPANCELRTVVLCHHG